MYLSTYQYLLHIPLKYILLREEDSAVVQKIVCRVVKVGFPYHAGFELTYNKPKVAPKQFKTELTLNLLLRFELLIQIMDF